MAGLEVGLGGYGRRFEDREFLPVRSAFSAWVCGCYGSKGVGLGGGFTLGSGVGLWWSLGGSGSTSSEVRSEMADVVKFR